MGQDTPSNTDLANKTVASLEDFLDWLLPQHKWILKKYTRYLRQHRSIIHRATHFLPIISSLIIIQVQRDIAHAEELTKVYKELFKAQKAIDELRGDIAKLKPSE